MADLAESTPAPAVMLTRLPVPDPVAIDSGKSILPLKPMPAIPAPTSAPIEAAVGRSVAAGSTRRVGRPVGFPRRPDRPGHGAPPISCSLRHGRRPPVGRTRR